MIWVIILLCLLTFIVYGFVTTIKPQKYPPGPVWFPFIGSSGILQKMTKKFGSEYRALLELSKQYSTNVLGMKTSSELIVVVFGVKNVRQVFHDKDFDARPHNFFAQLRNLGKKNLGITFANGDIWKEHRAFAVKNLKYVGYGKTVMEKEIQNELGQLLEHINNNRHGPISLDSLLSESVMNVLWTYVAGERIPLVKLRYMLSLFRQRGKAFTVGGGILNQIPWCRFIIPELSGYSLITKLNAEISQIIEEAIEKHKNKEILGNDFIYLFLQEIYANKSPTFTEEQLKMVCLDLLIAGTQTSSNVLSFALLRAMKSPDIQEKIYNEIVSTIGDRTPCWNDNESLVYTSAYIQELHRYYTIVPMAGPRQLLNDTSIDGYLIPKGSTILMSIGDINFDPDLWEDPHVFKPERFIDESGMLKNSEHLFPFGLGRRRCPGDSLAKSFIFITLVGILQKYRIQSANGTVPSDKPIIGILSTPQPFSAEFTPRKKDSEF
ncbi:putative cytochrome P450 305a1 [Anticarsia gemmatalis]|uniref:putative cytochrome P450 305a1 n=1 Tax=Anticarsia gemmatalis TaxID=129554 RepID=UPI003F7640FB